MATEADAERRRAWLVEKIANYRRMLAQFRNDAQTTRALLDEIAELEAELARLMPHPRGNGQG